MLLNSPVMKARTLQSTRSRSRQGDQGGKDWSSFNVGTRSSLCCPEIELRPSVLLGDMQPLSISLIVLAEVGAQSVEKFIEVFRPNQELTKGKRLPQSNVLNISWQCLPQSHVLQ
ncbi:hypothetical protein U9M48_042133, partial [Paspalum notatum var. saurae]